MSSFYRNNRGMTLIEIMLVVVIMAVIAAGFSQMLWESKRFQAHIELKGEINDFKNEVALSLIKPASCKLALMLEENPIVFPADTIEGRCTKNGADIDCNEKPEKPSLVPLAQVMTSGRREYKPMEGDELLPENKVGHRLALKAMNLEFLSPMAPSADLYTTYLIDLSMIVDKINPDNSSGWRETKVKIPVIVRLEEDGSDYKVVECYVYNSQNGKENCIALGGRWLSNTNNAETPSEMEVTPEMCPKTQVNPTGGKCVFTHMYPLEANELPDGINCQGSENGMHERPAYCFYQDGGKIAQLACPSRNAGVAGKRCVFDSGSMQWKLAKMTAANTIQKIIRSCDFGVEITRMAGGTDILSWDESIIDRYYNGDQATPIWKWQSTHLGSVNRCKISVKQDTYKNCSNPDNLGAAMEGKAGSCQFVQNIKLYNEGGVSGTRINDCKALFPDSPDVCPSGVQNYTGWIYVTEATPRRFVKAPGAGTNIIEARGVPCFEVEVLPASATIEDAPANVAHTNYLTNGAADRIFQCHFKSQNNLEALFLCQNNTAHCTSIGTTNNDDKCNKPTAVFGPRSCWFAGGNGNANTRGVELSTHRGRILNQWFYMRAEPPPPGDLRFRYNGPVDDTALHSWDRDVDGDGVVDDATDVNGIVCNQGVRVLPAGQF